MYKALWLLLLLALPCMAEDPASLITTADQHYTLREQDSELQSAIDGYTQALKQYPTNYEAAWKLSKAYWYRGNYISRGKKQFFEKGREAGRKAVQNDPSQCEGHFWLGINTALLAETSGLFKALGFVDEVKSEIQRSMDISQNCECGGPQRVMGKLYAKLPFFKGGSKTKAIDYLQQSLKLCPQDTQSKLFLAEIYIDDDRKKGQAIQLLQQVRSQEADPAWIPETKQNKILAEKMLREIKQNRTP